MNKKSLLVISLILMIATLSTTLVSGVQACDFRARVNARRWQTILPFTIEPDLVTGNTPATLFNTQTIATGEVTLVKDGTVEISWGQIMKSQYEGVLGSGYFTREKVYGERDNPWVSGSEGWAILKSTLEITDGPLGKGTLTGWGYSEESMVSSRVPRYQMWTYTKMTGELHKGGKSIDATVYVVGLTAWDPTYATKIWWLKTTIVY